MQAGRDTPPCTSGFTPRPGAIAIAIDDRALSAVPGYWYLAVPDMGYDGNRRYLAPGGKWRHMHSPFDIFHRSRLKDDACQIRKQLRLTVRKQMSWRRSIGGWCRRFCSGWSPWPSWADFTPILPEQVRAFIQRAGFKLLSEEQTQDSMGRPDIQWVSMLAQRADAQAESDPAI